MHRTFRNTFSSVVLLVLGWLGSATLWGCEPPARSDPEVAAARRVEVVDDFQAAFLELASEYGSPEKADLFGGRIDPCRILDPLMSAGDYLAHSGLFVGVSGSGVLGVGTGFGGVDLVWDLYHRQMTVSKYAGFGVSTPGMGASVKAYTGFAAGFETGVDQWNSHFVNFETAISLPFLIDYISLTPFFFVSGVDRDDNGLIGPTEIIMPPYGVHGFGIGVQLGFDLLPSGLPISGSVSEGLWSPHKPGIRYFYDRYQKMRFFRIGRPMNVHLIDSEWGTPCHPDWPEEDGHRSCFLQFGEPEWDHTESSLHVAYAICAAAGNCALPLTWPMSAVAIGVGAYRDFGGDYAVMCPDDATADGG